MCKTTENSCIVIVDLDFTLVNVNTTFDFLNTFFHRKYILFSRLLRPLTLLNTLFSSDVYKQLLLILCIKKKAKEELERYAEMYSKHILRCKSRYLNTALLSLLKNVRYKKILLSSSVDVVAKAFKTLDFDLVIGSKIYYDSDGRFIGIQDLYSKKHEIIKVLSKHFRRILIIEDKPESRYMLVKGVKVIRVLHK